uniref:Uncharacterized protein n=1 Tax=Setaria viridis TaxID=4556 RepID=A0A4U6TPQ4_SETVI|nr:hypothetical protein SEVIR_8G048801v2 [Setaria viridis]
MSCTILILLHSLVNSESCVLDEMATTFNRLIVRL